MSVELQTAPTQVGEAIPPPTDIVRTRRRFDIRRDGVRLFAVLAGLLAINLLFWILFVRPRQTEITELQRKKQTASVTEKQARDSVAKLRRVHQHVMGLQTGIEKFYGEMLSTSRQRLVPFQRAVARVGSEYDCEPERVAVGLTTLEDEGIEGMAQTFPISGGYENLRSFLARLESLEQFLIVREVSLSGAKEGGAELQLNVMVETYFDAPGLRQEKERERADKAKRRNSRSRRGSGGRRS